MLSRLFLLVAMVATGTLVSADGDNAWHLDYIYDLVNEALDPIISPNGYATHMHKVIGGNAFGASYNYNTYNAATCSSLRIQADKSNYWMPTLNWINGDGTFTPLNAHIRFYYFLGQSSPYERVSAFPKGLRMLAGDPNNKAPTVAASFTCQINEDFSNSLAANNFNFPRDCPYGMKTELYFPPCWDGVNLYKSDGSHMHYPDSNPRDGSCPFSHPVRVPAIQLEYTWWPSNDAPGQTLAGNLAWANGDTTGYGVHGDFVNGWDQSVLAAALNSSACLTGGAMAMENCPILGAHFDDAAAQACNKPALGVLTESFGNADHIAIPRLPGCNPLWASGAKPTCSPAVAPLDVSKFKGTDGSLIASADDNKAFVYPTTPGWHNVACMKENTALLNTVAYSDAKMTSESCTATCGSQGYSFAATGQIGSWNCICGTGINTAQSVYPGGCTVPCPGNSSEGCGNSYIFNVWYAPNGTVSTPAKVLADGSKYLGCYNNPNTVSNGLLGAATYSFSSSAMTTAVCISACSQQNTNWAAITGGKTCYCGNNYAWGTGALQPASYCTEACTGNSSEACGDYYKSSVYNITDAEIANSTTYHPPGWQGCYQDQSGHLALNNNSWTSTTSMTPQSCINGCSELGYAYAGVEYASQCYCGSSFTATSRLPSSQCNSACTGNSSAVCGGSFAMDLYSTTYATTNKTAAVASKPAGFVGCYQDTGSAAAFSSPYTFTLAAQTVESCKSSCVELGYAYAGVENGNRCQCSKTAPKTTQVVTSLYCTTKCAGNSTETCGSGSNIEVYSLANAIASTPMPGISSSSYVGCYDNTNRGLTNYTYYNAAMTVELCTQTCKDMGYGLGGVSGSYCYCGNSWTGNSVKYPAGSCQTTKCAGNSTEFCGGTSYAALYNTSAAVLTYTKPAGWLSCWTDSASTRALQGYTYQASPMSAKACRVACSAQNFTIAGTENGKQCFCGNTIASGSKAPTSSCSTLCAGSTNETCGGSGFIDLYNSTDVTASNGVSGYLGCYTDYNTLSGSSYSSDFLSVDTCNQWCYAHNYSYSGIRAGNQCRCGNAFPTLATTTSACANPCTGNSTQNCGQTNTVAVYSLSKADTQVDYQVSTNATGYAGCWREGSTRLLPTYYFTSTSMTNQLCISNCAALGYAYAGSEYASQCYCAAKLDPNSGAYRIQDADCNMACKGGGGNCGGSSILSLYSTANAAAAASTVEGLKGCFAPGSFASAPPLTYYGGYMTSDLCRRSCRNGGFSIAGLTNANTCVCGNSPTYGAAVAAASCNAPCSGNTTQTCGATFSSAYSIYDTTGAGSQAPAGYPANYVGCITDYSTRVLGDYTVTASGMTSDLCRRTCAAKGYYTYGTESGTQCFCSATDPIVPLLADSQCTSACGGAPTERCGAGGKLSFYSVYGQAGNKTTSVSANASVFSTSAKANVTGVSTSASSSKAASVTGVSTSASSKAASVTGASTSVSSKTAAVTGASTMSSSKVSSVTGAATSTSSKAASVTVASTSASSKAASSITGASTSVSSVKSSSSSASSVSSAKASSSASSSASAAKVISTSSIGAADFAVTKASTTVSSSSSAVISKASSSLGSAITVTATTTVKSSSTTSASAASSTSTSLGCYSGSSTSFNNAVMTGHDSLTPSMCQIWCNANYYTYSAVSGGNTCGCSNTLSGLTSVSSSNCSASCSGSTSTTCGGTVNSVYGVYIAQAASKPWKRYDSSSPARKVHARAKREARKAQVPILDKEKDMKKRGFFSSW